MNWECGPFEDHVKLIRGVLSTDNGTNIYSKAPVECFISWTLSQSLRDGAEKSRSTLHVESRRTKSVPEPAPRAVQRCLSKSRIIPHQLLQSPVFITVTKRSLVSQKIKPAGLLVQLWDYAENKWIIGLIHLVFVAVSMNGVPYVVIQFQSLSLDETDELRRTFEVRSDPVFLVLDDDRRCDVILTYLSKSTPTGNTIYVLQKQVET